MFAKTQRFCRVSNSGFTAGTRKHRDARNRPTLKRFRHFKRPAEIGYANQQGSSAYVRCPTDHQNWHVILPQQGEVIWVPVVIAGMITTGIPFSFSASNRSNVDSKCKRAAPFGGMK